MKFRIRRTPEIRRLGQKKDEAPNPLNLVGPVFLLIPGVNDEIKESLKTLEGRIQDLERRTTTTINRHPHT